MQTDHEHNELSKVLQGDTHFLEHIKPWVDKVEPEPSVFNINIGDLLRASGEKYLEIIRTFIDAGGDLNLAKAVQLMDRFRGESLDLCMEVVGKTDDKKILSSISGMLTATGVVMGEYGIAEAYEAKAAALEKYKNSENQRIATYTKAMAMHFLDQARRSRRHSEEEHEYRRLEFEENSRPPKETEE